jgi:multiple sugar transport system substrate-binding protein
MLKKFGAILSVCTLSAALGACTNSGPSVKEAAPPQMSKPDRLASGEPLTLKVWTGGNEQAFKESMVEPIKRKFPNVTLELIPLQQNPLEKLIVAGNAPDIIQTTKNFLVLQVLPSKLELDLTPLVRKYKHDLERYDPDLIASIRKFDEQGKQLYGLPSSKVVHANLYNKQLFDKFAVPLPKDDMTWDEAIQLARQMTRLDNGVQYRGMDLQFYNMIGSQLSLPIVDRNGKSNMAAWSRPAEMWRQLFSIPGNNVKAAGTIAKVMDPFYKGSLAMVVINPSHMFTTAKQHTNLDWEIATVPVYPEAPGVDPYMNYAFISVTSTSKYPDEAFQVIAHLNSDELQTASIRRGEPTVLKSQEIQKLFGADIPELKGKNTQALFKHRQADQYVSPYFDSAVESLVKQKFNEIVEGKKDNNTLLRELDEEINKKVEEIKASKG